MRLHHMLAIGADNSTTSIYGKVTLYNLDFAISGLQQKPWIAAKSVRIKYEHVRDAAKKKFKHVSYLSHDHGTCVQCNGGINSANHSADYIFFAIVGTASCSLCTSSALCGIMSAARRRRMTRNLIQAVLQSLNSLYFSSVLKVKVFIEYLYFI